jgi:hypothetical protein
MQWISNFNNDLLKINVFVEKIDTSIDINSKWGSLNFTLFYLKF